MKVIKLMLIGSVIPFAIGCGGGEQSKAPKMIEVNSENLSEEAKVITKEIAQETQNKLEELEEDAETSKENIKEKTKALMDALDAMEKEFETNE